MELVAFQEPIFSTVQGEGVYTGMPSTFVRLWGCDSSCDWCDTKESWRPGSKSIQCDVETVIDRVQKLGNRHVVITGGNPLLQAEETRGLVLQLRDRGHHVTLETQGTIYHRVVHDVNLLSLSPKLHNNTDFTETYRRFSHFFTKPSSYMRSEWDPEYQFKIVVQTQEDVREAIVWLNLLFDAARDKGTRPDRIHMVLQPEWSIGRKWYTEILRIMRERQAAGDRVDSIRVLPQMHKYVGIP